MHPHNKLIQKLNDNSVNRPSETESIKHHTDYEVDVKFEIAKTTRGHHYFLCVLLVSYSFHTLEKSLAVTAAT